MTKKDENIDIISRDKIRFSMVNEENGYFSREDEVFNKMAKEVNAVSAGEGEMPCIVVTNLSISTDQFMMGKARDYKYIQVNDPYKVQDGEYLPLYSTSLTRAEAATVIIKLLNVLQ